MCLLYNRTIYADIIDPLQWYTYLKEWRVVRNAQKRSSDMVSQAAGSIRSTFQARERGTSQSLEPVHEDTNHNDGDAHVIESGENGERTLRGSQLVREKSFLVKDANDFMDEREVENNLKWKVTAARVDDVSRTLFPLAYSITLGVILSQAF